LTHAGSEHAFAHAEDAFGDPARLALPLRLGVTVIVAHIATTGRYFGEESFERMLPMFARYKHLYTDISSLTQINKLGYLKRALAHGGLTQRMVYGSDWPLQFFPLISPWYHINLISVTDAWRIGGIKNQWDRDVALKKAFDVPDEVFHRSARLLLNHSD